MKTTCPRCHKSYTAGLRFDECPHFRMDAPPSLIDKLTLEEFQGWCRKNNNFAAISDLRELYGGVTAMVDAYMRRAMDEDLLEFVILNATDVLNHFLLRAILDRNQASCA